MPARMKHGHVGHYARWCDADGVVHWIETQSNLSVFTSCRMLVERLPHQNAKSSYKATWSHPTCVMCVVRAIDDVYVNPY